MNQLLQTLKELEIKGSNRDMEAFSKWMVKINNVHWAQLKTAHERYININNKF